MILSISYIHICSEGSSPYIQTSPWVTLVPSGWKMIGKWRENDGNNPFRGTAIQLQFIQVNKVKWWDTAPVFDRSSVKFTPISPSEWQRKMTKIMQKKSLQLQLKGSQHTKASSAKRLWYIGLYLSFHSSWPWECVGRRHRGSTWQGQNQRWRSCHVALPGVALSGVSIVIVMGYPHSWMVYNGNQKMQDLGAHFRRPPVAGKNGRTSLGTSSS